MSDLYAAHVARSGVASITSAGECFCTEPKIGEWTLTMPSHLETGERNVDRSHSHLPQLLYSLLCSEAGEMEKEHDARQATSIEVVPFAVRFVVSAKVG